MSDYRVRWEIDIDADSPQKAALKALEIQQDPRSRATIFEVSRVAFSEYGDRMEALGSWVQVDLEYDPTDAELGITW